MKTFPLIILAASVTLPTIHYVGEVKAADAVVIPLLEQGDHALPIPHNSQTKEQVKQKFGEPQQKIAAVGNPPISRWVYEKYTVFFENDLVLHTVLKK